MPSHLLPPLESLAPRMMSALMRPAPHVAALGGHGEPKADVQLEAEREAQPSGRTLTLTPNPNPNPNP